MQEKHPMKNQLCRIALSGLLATGLALGPAAAFAQQDSPAPDASAQQPGSGHMGGRQQMTPDEQVARMTKRYNLSADQQTQIKPIVADAQQQMMALRQDSSMAREDKMTKMMSIREATNTKISAILNDSQKQQFAEDQQKMQQRMQQHGGGAPAGGPPAQ
jgi:predicted O-linked N-acetylglucosamine transferase (SPINDLY family)